MKSRGIFAVYYLSLVACQPLLLTAEPTSTTLGPGSNGISQRVDYQESGNDVPNVERGFLVEWDGASGTQALAAGQPLVRYGVDWGAFCNSPLSATATDNLTQDFSTLRANGTKAVLHISYAQSPNTNICGFYDADSLSTMAGHLSQLGTILQANDDVIAFVEAGLLGHYGQWGTAGNPSNEPLVATDSNTRVALLQGLLAAVPVNRSILIPDPNFRSYLVDSNALTPSLSRIGYQDAGFLATATDNGTYTSAQVLATAEADIAQNTVAVPLGGETVTGDSNNRYSCTVATAAMAALRPTYLRADSLSASYLTWKNGGCLQEITNGLGYRYVVQNVSYTLGPVAPGGTVEALITLTNTGFAPIYNAHQASLVLVDSSGNVATGLQSESVQNDDVTQWMPGQTIVFVQTLQLPAGMAAGLWSYALSIPDVSGNPAFAVQLASDAPGYSNPMFSAVGGYNQLRIGVTVQ